ncbi:MAG: tRNA-2-methylthio-N(6)-dimethylallyladenosine synthase [Chlamydiae bacterium]|nr:tRNA-2-methylthio-N(6)-dimethylallyladenosine synthase [Chlamydiota bacterium]
MKNPETFHIRTYGCQMNELDTDMMRGTLEKRGLLHTEEAEADLLIFNTCSIRDLAERKVMGKIGRLGRTSQKKKIIGITGCMANAKKDSLFRKLPHVDFVLGTNNLHNLEYVLDQLLETGKQQIQTDDLFREDLDYLATYRKNKVKGYVSIIRGCNKYCTYCVVPYTRGKEVSRPAKLIYEECTHLANQGYKEITLLGQNVNSYGKDNDEMPFHDLLYQLDSIQGIERIRFLTSHPIDITKELMQAIRDLDSLCEFVHFPLQAGSNRILKKMHRIYTKELYFEKVAMLKELVPNVALGTDIIVGFPTETDEEFQETFDALKAIRYHVGFLYSFSSRKGTPAYRWEDDIPEEVKQERLRLLLELQNTISQEHKQQLLGQTTEVLIDRMTKDQRFLRGRTRCWQKVMFEGPTSLIGTLQKVKITGFTHQTLTADLQIPVH